MKTEQENLQVVSDKDVISVNARKRLGEIEKKFPNMEIIIGKAEKGDKPVSVDLAGMDYDRQHIIDAATETVLGKRIDILDKPVRFPWQIVTAIIFFMAGVGSCYIVYNTFIAIPK
jgi:hypothetical protein